MKLKNIIALACVTLATTSVQAMEKTERKAAPKAAAAESAKIAELKKFISVNLLKELHAEGVLQQENSLTREEQHKIIVGTIMPLLGMYQQTKKTVAAAVKKAQTPRREDTAFMRLMETLMKANLAGLGRRV